MKKLILLMVVCSLVFPIMGQHTKNSTEKIPVPTPDPANFSDQDFIIGQKLTEANIGKSMYDLQTYGAMPQRFYVYPDGTIAATWMMAFETTAWIDRGTGYNYFDGDEWGEYPTEKLETIRTGWPSYAPLGANGEALVSHALPDVDWVIALNKRENKGEGAWMETYITGPEAGVGIVWPAMVTNGTDHNTIHLLARTYGTIYMEQDGALVYSRSTDGGATWDIQNHFFEELGPDYFVNIEADGYAWAQPHGNTLAFSVGCDAGPACIMKSTDNGDNWEFIEVYEAPFYPPPGVATLSYGAGDGCQSVALDSEDNVHLVYGRMRYVYNDAGELQFYPATEGLIYWNETMPVLDSTIISTYTLDYLEAGGNLAGRIIDPGMSGIIEFPNYYASLTTHPQLIIDQSNRIFVLWSGVAPGYTNGVWNYRHIYGNSSNDNGLTWNGIVDLTGSLLYTYSECIFPSIAPVIYNNQFHFQFQNDGYPGILVYAAQQETPSENFITYMGIETAILTEIKENKQIISNRNEVSQNFPNPFSTETVINISMADAGNISFMVSDIAGRTVHYEDFGMVTGDNFRIKFNRSSLPSGIYYYTITSDSETFTGKMMIK
jgi:hypothetical protein